MITGIGFDYEKFYFPHGEMQVRVSLPTGRDIPNWQGSPRCSILWEFERTEEVFEILLIADALKRDEATLEGLSMHYVPFSRQDRVAVKGDSFSLKVLADIINSLNLKEVYIIDPHSDVTTALFNNLKVREQYDVFEGHFRSKKNFYLISPDAGALKKIYKLAALVKTDGVIECSKIRDPKDGKVTGVQVYADDLNYQDCYIVDDICDGGRTFIEIAKKLKHRKVGKIVLMVTHGFFSKGLNVFDGLIDEIYTIKGREK